MGGCETEPGIFINWSLRLGTTASRCITFNKFWPISRDFVFDIRILELWVVNEVFKKKKTNVPKRDFYNTVVMWNKLGKHKAREDNSKVGRRDRCLHDEINTGGRSHCAQVDILETNERHFEPSNCSLPANNNDETHLTIKNRLVGLTHESISPNITTERQRHDSELPKPSHYANELMYHKPKKVAAPVSTQVDNTMITELKNQSTSTSHVKVTSRFTQSEVGYPSHIEGNGQTSTLAACRVQQVGGGLLVPLDHNTQLYHDPERSPRADGRYQQVRGNSFPYPTIQGVESPPVAISSLNNYVDLEQQGLPRNSIQSDRNSIGLPEVPDYHRASALSGSIRSSLDEVSYTPQIQELTWPNKKNMRSILPYLPPPLHPMPYQGEAHGDSNSKRISQSGSNILREDPREVSRDLSTINVREINRPHATPKEEIDPLRKNPQDSKPDAKKAESSTKSTKKEMSKDKLPSQVSLAASRSPSKERQTASKPTSQPKSSPEKPSAERSSPEKSPQPSKRETQPLCRCGSKELNLTCFCKKPTLLEDKNCRCSMNYECDGEYACRIKGKGKKEKKSKGDKEAKAEEKRRKKEEKNREKREKKEQKAREKEAKKKCKEKARKTKGGGGGGGKVCGCCKCGGDEGDTGYPSEASQSEAKSKRRKPKNRKSDEYCRPCNCPDQKGLSPGAPPVASPGMCNHPDSPCPAMHGSKRGSPRPLGSGPHCGDPSCTRGNSPRSYEPFKNCCCTGNGDACNFTALTEIHPMNDELLNINRSSNQLGVTHKSQPSRTSLGTHSRNTTASPALIFTNEVGHGDTPELQQHSSRLPNDPRFTFMPAMNNNLLIDLSRRGRDDSPNKRYVPPCVLYLDCTQVKDLCVIIKDKYEDNS